MSPSQRERFVFFLECSVIKAGSASQVKVKEVSLQPIRKDLGFLRLEFFSCDTNLPSVQYLSPPDHSIIL